MNHVYIDLGAYDGDSIRQFLRMQNLPVKPKEFTIYAFEPNPNMFPFLASLMNEFAGEMVVDTGAAWVKDEIREFALDTNNRAYGSTLMKSKQDIWDKFAKIEIHCFDFSEWIKQFANDYVIVKMDIEGAEFPILNKMLKDGTHKIMDQLWLETHSNKVGDYTTKDSQQLFQRLRQDIKVEEWE